VPLDPDPEQSYYVIIGCGLAAAVNYSTLLESFLTGRATLRICSSAKKSHGRVTHRCAWVSGLRSYRLQLSKIN
jgi:hypothetical protein